MSQLRRFGPLLALAAVIAWCCWTQVRETRPLLANMHEETLPRIERRMVRPEFSAPSTRDPFKRTPRQTTPSPATDQPPVEPTEPRVDPATLLNGFRLDATMLGARERFAVINGRIYSEGQTVTLEDFPTLNFRLQQVLTDSVVLQIEQETHEISYSHYSGQRGDQAGSGPTVPVAHQQLPAPEQLGLVAAPNGQQEPLPTKLMSFFMAAEPVSEWEVNASPFEDEEAEDPDCCETEY